MKTKRMLLLLVLTVAIIPACDLLANTPQADPNAFNTMVAQTAQAYMTLTAIAQPLPTTQPAPLPGASQENPTQPALPPTDEALIKQALLAKLGWNEADMEFSMGENTGQFARGSAKNKNEINGAAWFAAKDGAGKWIIAYIGHGVPLCSEVDPYNIPVDWISHCMNDSYQTIERGAAPPPPAATDVYAPDPLGPLFSSMYFSVGMCYDMDVLFHTTDASCDVYLDSNGLLAPRNGGLFSGYATLTAPSLNQCKAAQLSAAPIAPNSDLYMCFKTNLGKYGFFVARQIDMSGIVFDAYVFP